MEMTFVHRNAGQPGLERLPPSLPALTTRGLTVAYGRGLYRPTAAHRWVRAFRNGSVPCLSACYSCPCGRGSGSGAAQCWSGTPPQRPSPAPWGDWSGFAGTGSVKQWRTVDPNEIGSEHHQIWLVVEHDDYYQEELGCSVLLSLFCDPPRDKPVQAP